jgi:hypothetical protein
MLWSTLLAHGVDWVNEGAHICDCERGSSIDGSRQGQGDLVGLWAAEIMVRDRNVMHKEPEHKVGIIEASNVKCA